MKNYLKILALAIAAVFLVAGSVWATPILRISDGTTTIDVNDNSANDINPSEGIITYTGGVGTFSINVSTGISKPVIGAAEYPKIHLDTLYLSGGAGTIDIWFTDTGFSLPDTIPGFVSKVGGITEGTVELKTYLDNSNGTFGTTTLLGDLGPYSASSFSGSNSVNINPSDPFSLTMDVTIHHGDSTKVSSVDAQVNPVPEPATALLMGVGLGLLGLGAVYRKKLGKA